MGAADKTRHGRPLQGRWPDHKGALPMKSAFILIAVLALAAGSADAKSCTDAKNKFTKCPPAATASMVAPASVGPVCKVGKPCGKSCIAKDKVCHK